MTVRKTASMIKGSMLVIAATMLAACGDGSSGAGGATQVSVANVVGDAPAAATTAITGAKLTVAPVTQASSATVAKGNVISETPAAGTSAASGSAVALVVSSGPATTTYTIGGTLIGLAPCAAVHVLNGSEHARVA